MEKQNLPETLADRLQRLETVVKNLESEDQSIEKSLAEYEEGINLIRKAQADISNAEQKVHILGNTAFGEEES
ncbi:exodeoxyribonuclease VII small subunit (plasmid) [Halioglobus japonicus]|uniref:Exodeoxyribonuclease 7 small subunit n=1 Tax=Halioglobus japonicus TaxID=930805 RepID=A0AAP8MBL2_9GAMM|nr:exodeoxyribonuclease VII small subunit [Halioglobus japonicus]AQA16849.1 exodeoxyribonuclease VII small subunit [Halioglobus japonicus]AQA20067.1 exodeoxyribonuclease VII small subunit [Halioglobus japonicus]AQA20403.1 exodeoxyribonuclease VII small subunit [Halioglobus japonicus]PLW84726.1 exodeoxyribonuclease VII small subunit [Halioglobus japonicus]GHD21096.1 hypothetical protein GCM10007052_31500 [Halioglobus japonicus]